MREPRGSWATSPNAEEPAPRTASIDARPAIIKVCGITRAEDALHAAHEGATAIGFVFWQGSPRAIDPQRALGIAAQLPTSVAKVGVFVNERLERVCDIVAEVGLTTVQLHGEEPAAYARDVPTTVWRSLTLDAIPRATEWPVETTFLCDASDAGQRGGTGRTVDWPRAAVLARAMRVVLAGGLTPENVGEAVRIVRPIGVDVSSGVECAPGVKDHDRVTRFVRRARQALAHIER